MKTTNLNVIWKPPIITLYEKDQLLRYNGQIWKDVWQMASLGLSFLIRSTYSQHSSKNNLFKWKKESDPTCPLCKDKSQALEHVLSSCKTALGNGRYTWRLNIILEELVKFTRTYMKSEPIISTHKFYSERGRIYAGAEQTVKHRVVPGKNLLGSSGDWGYLLTYHDGITSTPKQYPAKVCNQTLFFGQGRTLKSSWQNYQ